MYFYSSTITLDKALAISSSTFLPYIVSNILVRSNSKELSAEKGTGLLGAFLF
jgi:hypothetical protein